MVIEAVIAHGSRKDIASLALAVQPDGVTAASLIEDAIYAVRRRSLQ
jgi:hypothetical protein